MLDRFASIEQGDSSPPHPWPVFFYGTLSLPHILQQILDLSEPPTYIDGSVYGWELKMWGPYPALVLTNPYDIDRVTNAKVWMMPGGEEGERMLKRLEQYETENYRKVHCMIYFADGSDPQLGYTFQWNSYPEELTDGTFDPSSFPISSAL